MESERKMDDIGIRLASNEKSEELRAFNENHLRFYLYDAHDFPSLSVGEIPTCMAYNYYLKKWKFVDIADMDNNGESIGGDEYIRELAKYGKEYPFDEKAALEFARNAHAGQFRKDGVTPYIEHPMAVVKMLRHWGVENQIIICVAYLHDVLEDTDVSEETIESRFSYMVSARVAVLTRLKNENKDGYLKRVARERGYEVRIVKCADRLCNTLDFIRLGRIEKAREYLCEARCIFESVDADSRIPLIVKKCINGSVAEIESRMKP